MKKALKLGSMARAAAWAGGLIALAAGVAATAFAQPTVSGLTAAYVSHSTARIAWTASPASNRQLAWDTKAYWDANKTYRYKTPRWNQFATSQSAVITGLTPGTTYVASPLACDASNNCLDASEEDPQVEFTTTAEPATHPALPTEPDLSGFDTSSPVEDVVLNVASDCSDLQSKITAAASATYSGQTVAVVIPAGTTCTPSTYYTLPPKTGDGWVVVRSSGTLPPEGTRLDPATYSSQLATIRNPNTGYTGLFDLTDAHHYRFKGIEFTHPPIADENDVVAEGQRYLIRLDGGTGVHHFIFDRCWIHGRGYPDRVLMGIYAQQQSYLAFLDSYFSDIAIWRAYQSGIAVTHTTDAINTYTGGTVYFGNASASVGAFTVELSGSGSGHFRLYAERDGSVKFKHDIASGLTVTCTGCTSSYDASLTVPDNAFSLISGDGSWEQGTITNAQFKTATGGTTGNPWTVQDGSSTGLGWEGSFGLYMVDCSYYLAQNNYFGVTGIGVYAENYLGTEPTHDVKVVRNTFQSDPNLFVKTPGDSNRIGLRRQHVEFKQGVRVLVEGNTFLDAWAGVNGVPSPAVLLAVAGDATHPDMRISDFTIRSNLIVKHPSCFFVNGTNVSGAQMRVTERVLIENNVCEADAYARSLFLFDDTPWDGAMRGMQINLVMGGEDYTIRHNTFFGGLGYQPNLLKITDLPLEGLTVQDNIFFLQKSAGGSNWGEGLQSSRDYADEAGVPDLERLEGTAGLNEAVIRVPSTQAWTFDHNVIVAGCASADSCTGETTNLLDVTTKQAAYPSSNYWPTGSTYGARIAAVGFADPSERDFRLGTASPYQAGDVNAASDNREVGVVYDELEPRVGAVKDAGVSLVGRTAAIVQYTAPDGAACTVEFGTSPAAGSGARIKDQGGTRQRRVVLSPLAPATSYYYRIMCATIQPVGTFTTSTAEGPTSLPLRLVPPGGSSVSKALVEYGPTAALGSETAATSCEGGCTITIPATRGEPVFHRVLYQDADHAELARSAVWASIAP